jgi:hypothetical protein
MKNFFSLTLKLIVLGCVVVGAGLIYNSMNEKAVNSEPKNVKAAALKKTLAKYSKPQRVEINKMTERLSSDVEEIKKLQVGLDPNSKFYISINLFTDESDPEAPLIAQINFFDIASGNKIKEENANLE